MGTEAGVGRRRLLLFAAATLCSLAVGRGEVYTSEPEVRVAENKPAKLLCSYSGFRSPRVEWKFAQGDTTSLVCYNSKITVPPSKPTVSVPSSATIGTRAVLTCSESDGSPPSEYYWLKDGTQMPTEPKSSRAFSNSSYTLNHKTGELIFDPVSASDTGEYTCQAQNGYGTPVRSDPVRMQAVEVNVGGIVAAVLVTLILLGVLAFGIWFAYSRGYFNRMKKGTANKKVIYSQPAARSEGEFRQTSSFLV
uniref:Junctional adhesion molecule A n=1 Tax=Rousettus aegyptiacus TaxID=9407 RepID=A0A7J8BD87_ROUAE|nr:F11 receptor [Rousettus aegyptiacus]